MLTFAEGSATLRCTSFVDPAALDPRFFRGDAALDWRIEQIRGRFPAENNGCTRELEQIVWNLVALKTLEGELARLYDVSPFERYRGVIVAHANERPPKGAFASNYELSRARAEEVQVLVERSLTTLRRDKDGRPPLNIEWLLVASGADGTYLGVDDSWRSATRGHLKRDLSAEVQFVRVPDHLTALQRKSLEPRKSSVGSELELLDYVYFMTTSAGANDLAPATGFVQFVAAVGHIFQLFFFVVAFNVILAFRREPLTGGSGAAAVD
ncbi:MAG TPA: hypothetical protein VGQ76_24045 [Thermoanaerobaculia bacterium]|jgi:hypothetical protein|nr:hypothetical protein [Thermoanaerobaculia bacterium]